VIEAKASVSSVAVDSFHADAQASNAGNLDWPFAEGATQPIEHPA
jgi:hypothetical protein